MAEKQYPSQTPEAKRARMRALRAKQKAEREAVLLAARTADASDDESHRDRFQALLHSGALQGPRMQEMAAVIVEQFGGAAQFAKVLHDEFKEAKAGSPSRARVLDLAARIMKGADKEDAERVELSMLSDEDLERQSIELIKLANWEIVRDTLKEMPMQCEGCDGLQAKGIETGWFCRKCYLKALEQEPDQAAMPCELQSGKPC